MNKFPGGVVEDRRGSLMASVSYPDHPPNKIQSWTISFLQIIHRHHHHSPGRGDRTIAAAAGNNKTSSCAIRVTENENITRLRSPPQYSRSSSTARETSTIVSCMPSVFVRRRDPGDRETHFITRFGTSFSSRRCLSY